MTSENTEFTFPFMPTSDVHVVFPAIPFDYMKSVLSACPPDFFKNRSSTATKLMVSGWTEERQKWAVEHFVTRNAEVAKNQIKCIQMWTGTFQIRHEEKEAVVAWLFSIAFTEIPPSNW